MKHDYAELTRILKPFIDAEEGETGDYPEVGEVLREVVEWKKQSERELREIWEINKNRTMMIDASDCHQAIGQIDLIKEILENEASDHD